MRIFKKIDKIYEYLGQDEKDKTFFDIIELGPDENSKQHLFRKLQDVANDKGLKLDATEGLIDPITKIIHVDKDTEEPLDSLFKMLDLDSLVDLPVRTLEIDDIVKSIERKDSIIETPEDVNDFSMTVVLNYDDEKTDPDAVSKLFNNIFDQLQASIAGVGKEKEEDSFILKYKLFAPKDVTLEELRALTQQNTDVFNEAGIKTIDITES